MSAFSTGARLRRNARLPGACAVERQRAASAPDPDPQVRRRLRRRLHHQQHQEEEEEGEQQSAPAFSMRSSCEDAIPASSSFSSVARRAPTTSTMDSSSVVLPPCDCRGTTTTTATSSISASDVEKGTKGFSFSALVPPSLKRPLRRLKSVRRSHLALDDRPLVDSTYERFRRFAETTNIHGFLPLARLKEQGCFFRVVFFFMLSCGITWATIFIRLEAINFNKETVSITTDHEQ